MDRQTFRRILLKSAFRKRKMYETLLDNVPMLKALQVSYSDGQTHGFQFGSGKSKLMSGDLVSRPAGAQNYERMNLADALVPRSYDKDQQIIKQGKHLQIRTPSETFVCMR